MNNEKKVDLPLALPAGTILAGKYVIRQALGQGGFGITYVAEDYKTKEKVAIKEFFPDTMVARNTDKSVSVHSGSAGENFVYGKKCFLDEAKTLAEFIGNENIVRVLSYFEENGTAYFAMEYIKGENFHDYIMSHGGKISWEDAQKFLFPVMDALAIVHSKGIIHRDVTPDNIYITKEGTVKLLDFGAARYSLGDKSRSLDVVLKHGFAPKEQYMRHGKQGPYTDVYTVGASFYYALTGKRPPDAIDRLEEDDLMPPTTLGVAIPPQAEDAILTALNLQATERFQDMAAFKNALTAAGTIPERTPVQESPKTDHISHTVAAQEHPAAPQKRQRDKKMLVMASCAAGVIFVLLGTVIALLYRNQKNEDFTAVAVKEQAQSHADVSAQPIESNENIIVDNSQGIVDNSQEDASAAEGDSDQDTQTAEGANPGAFSAQNGDASDAGPEEQPTKEDDPYSFEQLGYDYEKEMEWESHLYDVYDAPNMTWSEALEDAERNGGHLARINSEDEMKYILGLLGSYGDTYSYIYIGGARDSQSKNKKRKDVLQKLRKGIKRE